MPTSKVDVAFDLPWPWGGERFELRDTRPLNFITGPLFSGKTRLGHAIAKNLPDTTFVGLDRLAENGADVHDRMNVDGALGSRVSQALTWLVEDGASVSLVSLSCSPRCTPHLSPTRSLFLLTRSSAILDLAAVGPKESIILCPANHAVPIRVLACPGAPGYEAVASCLAPPEVRARTEGVVAVRTAAV